jgi:transposase
VTQIADLNAAIARFDAQLEQATGAHPDAALFRSAPGAGHALVPRLIAPFGSDRDRFSSAENVQTYSGIAPVTPPAAAVAP